MKQLYILRHAKSDYPENIADDHERPLNKRGEAACKKIADFIKQNNISPEVVLCSDALRTTQTINNIMKHSGNDFKVDYTPKLYLATPGEILKELAKIDSNISSAMIVSHNPGVENLTKILLKDGDVDSIKRLQVKYPTAGLAIMSVAADSWDKISPASAILERFIAPKMLP